VFRGLSTRAFGTKAHIGVDQATGLVHGVVTTAANVADLTRAGSPSRKQRPALRGLLRLIAVQREGAMNLFASPE